MLSGRGPEPKCVLMSQSFSNKKLPLQIIFPEGLRLNSDEIMWIETFSRNRNIMQISPFLQERMPSGTGEGFYPS